MREVKPLSFIYEIPNALPGGVCREAIRRFEEKTGQQHAGRIGSGRIEEGSIKKTTDIYISGRGDWKDIEGKLVLFPPFWTHIHRAAAVEKDVKYIATTWQCFA
jgi:hypothetical protein